MTEKEASVIELKDLILDFMKLAKISEEFPLNEAKNLLALRKVERFNKEFDGSLLREVVEPLKDSFVQEDDTLYAKIFSVLIEEYVKESNKLTGLLKKYSLRKNPRESILQRYAEVLNNSGKMNLNKGKLKKVFVLSRGTIGADVLINGIVISKVLKAIPSAEIIFVDSVNVGQTFFNFERVRSATHFIDNGSEVSLLWNRGGFSLKERLEYVADLDKFISTETADLEEEQYLIIDASTRLAQTGLLPVCPLTNYFFIPTFLTSQDKPEVRSLGAIVNGSLNKILGSSDLTYPSISNKVELGKFKEFNNLVAVHFGGEPELKYLSIEFEKNLVSLLIELGLKPVLIRTPKKREEDKLTEILDSLKKEGLHSSDIYEESAKESKFLTFKGGVDELAALINSSMVYIGYDSLGQHISAALGKPFVTVFTGHINYYFLKRWTPLTPGKSQIIEVDKSKEQYWSNKQEVNEKVLNKITSFIKNG